MPRRIVVFVALAVASAVLFVRLGFWQLDRLKQRRARNGEAAAQMANAEAPFDQFRRDNVALRRVVLEGVPDTANEFVVTGRSRNGSPGVHIITPYRFRGDTAVLVNRGWVYAPDAATADLSRWREARQTVHGYTQLLPVSGLSAPTLPTRAHAVRVFDTNHLVMLLPYHFYQLYVIAQDSGHIDSIPARLPLPALDDGPHLNYAIQWFCFAAIAVVGAAIVARRSRDSGLGTRYS